MPYIEDAQFGEVQAQPAHNIDVDAHNNKVAQLNGEQRAAFDRFVAALEHRQSLVLNLDAPGGTGQFVHRGSSNNFYSQARLSY